MKIEKLEVGMEFKNYKEFCSFLEMKIEAGNAKKAQFSEIEQYCKLGRVGHKIYVKEVYASPLEIIERRGRKGFYNGLLQVLITDHLITVNKPVTYVTRNVMLNNINMINENYIYGSMNVRTLAQYTSISEDVIYDFFNTSKSNFKSIFELALKKLEQKKIIFYSTVKMFAYTTEDNELVNFKEASDKEIKNLLEAEKNILEQMGFNNISQIRFSNNLWNEFNKKSIEKYNATYAPEGFKLSYRYNAYKIIVNEKFIEEDHNAMLLSLADEMEREEHKSELNKLIQERLLDNAKSRKNKIGFKLENQLALIRNNPQYVNYNQELIELLINRNTKRINFKSSFKSE